MAITDDSGITVWIKGMLAHDPSPFRGPEETGARLSLRVPMPAEGMTNIRAEVRGRILDYLKAAEVKQGDWLVINGDLKSDGDGEYVSATLACASTSIDWDRR